MKRVPKEQASVAPENTKRGQKTRPRCTAARCWGEGGGERMCASVCAQAPAALVKKKKITNKKREGLSTSPQKVSERGREGSKRPNQQRKKKKERAQDSPVCVAGPQPSGHPPPSPPPLCSRHPTPLFLSSPLPTGVLFMAEPFHLFRVVHPLATIHANEVEQMTSRCGCAHVRRPACLCIFERAGGWMGRLLTPLSAC